ncbi:MAG: GtrA family protein [Pseudonocardiaceae bacterium]
MPLRAHLPQHASRFTVAGGINTSVYYSLYLLLHTILPYLAAHLIAIFIAMIGSFFLNCYWTFQTPPTWRKFALFPLTNATNYLVTTLCVVVLVEWFGIDERVAPLLAAVAAIPVTFVLSRRVLTGLTGPSCYRPWHRRHALMRGKTVLLNVSAQWCSTFSDTGGSEWPRRQPASWTASPCPWSSTREV